MHPTLIIFTTMAMEKGPDIASPFTTVHGSLTRSRERSIPLTWNGKTSFFEVAITSKELMHHDIWITNCRVTPSANETDHVHYDLISDGCPNESDESIKYYNASEHEVQRFSFQTFRFNALPTAVVFLHCQVEICDPCEIDTRCKQGLSIC